MVIASGSERPAYLAQARRALLKAPTTMMGAYRGELPNALGAPEDIERETRQR